MIYPVYIVDIFRDVVAALGPSIQKASNKTLLEDLKVVDPLITDIHYDYGHYTDIRTKLVGKSKTAKQNKYPLICLFEDYEVTHGKLGITGLINLKLLILASSRADIERQQREATVFRPVLYPIYREFLKQLKQSGKFNIYSVETIQHKEIPRPHWGRPGVYKNEAYIFPDVLDGIEIANLQLETYLPDCL